MKALDYHKDKARISDESKVYLYTCSEYGRIFVVATVTLDPSLPKGKAVYNDDNFGGLVLNASDAFLKAKEKKIRYS